MEANGDDTEFWFLFLTKYLPHCARQATQLSPLFHSVNFTDSRCNENRLEVFSCRCTHNSFYRFQFTIQQKIGGKQWIVVIDFALTKNQEEKKIITYTIYCQSWIRFLFIPYHCHFKNVFDAWIVVVPAVFTQST